MQMYETLADRKMHLLFELWDKDGDGQISFAELALGLRKLSPPEEPVTDTASDAAEVGLPDRTVPSRGSSLLVMSPRGQNISSLPACVKFKRC